MSYPKKCDECKQFGEWCFCEPVPEPEAKPKTFGDMYVPALWAKESTRILDKNMVITRIASRKLTDDISVHLDRVQTRRGSEMSYPKIMIHEGKHDNRYILVRDPTEIGPAYLAMFMAMDQHDQAYCGIEDCETEFDMYTKAKSSIDIRVRHAAAKWLLEHRGGYGFEYENVYILALDTPVSMMERFNAST